MRGSAGTALDVSHVRDFQFWGQRASRQSLSENYNLGLKTYPGAPVLFFGQKYSVSPRTKSTSAHSRPPTGPRYHLKRFNFVLSGQLTGNHDLDHIRDDFLIRVTKKIVWMHIFLVAESHRLNATRARIGKN